MLKLLRTRRLLFLVLLAGIAFIGCTNNKKDTISDIEGVWISDEESSFNFASGIEKTGFQFYRNKNAEWEARGFILWNGEFSEEWKVADFHYDENRGAVDVTDEDGNIFRGVLDHANRKINGTLTVKQSDADSADNSLILVPADDHIVANIFCPRIPGEKGNFDHSYKVPEQLDDGIETGSIDDFGIDPEFADSLIQKIINQEYGRMESLLILKDNTLILEEYFYGYDRNRLHHIYSCTKSITSLLLGISRERHQGIIVEQPIFSFFPEYDSLKTEAKEKIRLSHVLSMTAGLQWHEVPKEMYESEDRIHYILNLPVETRPGERFLYNSGLSILIGDIVASREGGDVKGFADTYLFDPLGIKDYKWRTGKNGELEYWNGLQMKPRDMAKIGLVVLNDGKKDGQQIVPKDWIEESTKPRIAVGDYFEYGYQWWLRTKNTKQWWNEESGTGSTDEHDMIVALSWGSQYIMVVKDLDLVIVTTASNYNIEGKEHSAFPMVIEEIIPSMI